MGRIKQSTAVLAAVKKESPCVAECLNTHQLRVLIPCVEANKGEIAVKTLISIPQNLENF